MLAKRIAHTRRAIPVLDDFADLGQTVGHGRVSIVEHAPKPKAP